MGLKFKILSILGLLVFVCSIATSGYFWYINNSNKISTLESNLEKYTDLYNESKKTIDRINKHNTDQLAEIELLGKTNTEIIQESKKLENLMRKHNLEKLIKNKPKLIETRINSATEDVISRLEDITRKTNE